MLMQWNLEHSKLLKHQTKLVGSRKLHRHISARNCSLRVFVLCHKREIGSRRETRDMAIISLLSSKFSRRREPAAFTRARGI